MGLRESLVTLSAALESQGRRQELALTTEGLRFSEEVGSLKAIVQGLRMQVSRCIILWFRVSRDLLFGRALSVYLGTPAFLPVGLPYNRPRDHSLVTRSPPYARVWIIPFPT